MTGFTTALNQTTGKLQSVPTRWVDNPHVFAGAFVTPPAPEPEYVPDEDLAPDDAPPPVKAKKGVEDPDLGV